MKKNYFLAFILLFFINCSVTKKLNEKWVGKTKTELIKTFGEPESILEKSNEEKVYTYKNKKKEPSRLGAGKYVYVIESTIFYIDKFDKIYNIVFKRKILS